MLAKYISAKPLISSKIRFFILLLLFLMFQFSSPFSSPHWSQHCAYARFRFRHKNHLFRVREPSWFGVKYLFLLTQNCLEMNRHPVKNSLLWSPNTWLEVVQLPMKNNRFRSPRKNTRRWSEMSPQTINSVAVWQP